MYLTVDGLVFDLDNTLFDFERAFEGVVREFYEQHLRALASFPLVTNGPSQMQRHKCQALGLDRIAPFIIVSEEVGYAKPDPRIFRDALDASGLARGEQVMFVGDNPVTDIDGARRFGMRTAWVRRGRQFPADLHPPDHIVDSVLEVQLGSSA